MDILSRIIIVKIVLLVWKDKNKRKRRQVWPFFKKSMLPIHTRVVARPDRLRLFSTSKSVSKRKRSQVLGGRYAPKNRWKFKILAGIHSVWESLKIKILNLTNFDLILGNGQLSTRGFRSKCTSPNPKIGLNFTVDSCVRFEGYKQRDGIFRVLIIYRNLWSLVSPAQLMTFTMFRFFHKHTTS